MLSPSVTRTLIRADPRRRRRRPGRRPRERRLGVLTEREHDVALAVGRGLTNAEIARELHLSVPTVKAHVSRLFDKLQVTNRVQIAICVHDAGLVWRSGPQVVRSPRRGPARRGRPRPLGASASMSLLVEPRRHVRDHAADPRRAALPGARRPRRSGGSPAGCRRRAGTTPRPAAGRRPRPAGRAASQGAGVAGVREVAPSARDPQAVGLDRVQRPGRLDGERADRRARRRRSGSRTPASCPARPAGRRPGPSARPCRSVRRRRAAAAAPLGWYLRIT